jgi:hypothetical protein
MPDPTVARSSFEPLPDAGHNEADAVEDKRRYNREFMRRWRADPFHLAMERARRRERYYGGQKQRRVSRADSSTPSSEHHETLCGFCWKRPALKKIARLRVCESAPKGYVKVRIPYCGEC